MPPGLCHICPFALTVDSVCRVTGRGDGGGGGGSCDTPHLSQDDDLRVFTCAPPQPPCEGDRDASPSA